jgi:DNA-directed RNA polymerase specialized sigma24 family protein
MTSDEARLPSRGDQFRTTHWSLVRAAGGAPGHASREALATLCQRYWLPLYIYVRRRWSRADEAQDLTQQFFAQLLEKGSLGVATPVRGRFRSFLLKSVEHFLVHEWEKARAQKRGGGKLPISLDWERAAGVWEPRETLTPERLYDRQWATTLLEHVLEQVRHEYAAAGNAAVFKVLRGFIAGGVRGEYSAAAASLGMTEGAVRVAVHRLREKFRTVLRSEIAQTVDDPADVDDEIRWLFQTFAE